MDELAVEAAKRPRQDDKANVVSFPGREGVVRSDNLRLPSADPFAELAAAMALVERQRLDIAHAKDESRRLRTALGLEQAHAAGLSEKVVVLRSALKSIDADNVLVAPTGRTFTDGRSEEGADAAYYAGFETKAAKLGFGGRVNVRAG